MCYKILHYSHPLLFLSTVPSVQWGLIYLSYDEQEITLPITSNGIFIILGLDNDYGCDRFGTQASASNKFKVWERSEQGVFAGTNFQWMAICRQ